LVPADRAEAVGSAVREAVRSAGYQEPVITQTHAARGAAAITSAT